MAQGKAEEMRPAGKDINPYPKDDELIVCNLQDQATPPIGCVIVGVCNFYFVVRTRWVQVVSFCIGVLLIVVIIFYLY